MSDDEFAILHAVRIKGAAHADALGVAAAPVLDRLEGEGLLSKAGETYYALTPEGRERHAADLRERVGADRTAALGADYEAAFLPLNVELKALCAAWQEEESFELVEQAESVHERIEPFLAGAAEHAPHLAVYSDRLGAAMDAFTGGDGSALVAPIGDSYHNVWFELHEDLIVTLGRSRADEES